MEMRRELVIPEYIPRGETLRGPRVVAIDDDETIGRLYSLMLKKFIGVDNFRVFHDPYAAVQCFDMYQLCAMILDYEMPELNGVEVFKWMRTYEQKYRLPAIPVIFMTGNPQGLEAELNNAGIPESNYNYDGCSCYTIIGKPIFDMGILESKLKELCSTSPISRQ